MKNKIIIYAILILNSFQFLSSQNNEDIEKYELIAMLSLFSEGLNNPNVEVSKESLNKFLSKNVEISIINQDSFKNFVFLSITPSEKNENSNDETMPTIYSNFDCKEYVLGIHKNSLYSFKLKGYFLNDFNSFIVYLRKNNYKNVKRRKSFTKNYKVKGLDFDCLFRSLKIKQSKDLKKYPCISNTCMKIYKTHDY
ncbi:hypothetical protein [Winogradskyella sp.]|uniref:hypothetical protein n=1 Tax=Winogradskyella sp. TaxID=1883156 RepID=UPI003519AEC6